MAAPTGRAANPTNRVAKEARTPMYGELPGKKSLGKISAAAVPYRKKSYHSMVVPTVLARTARRRWPSAIACACEVSIVYSNWLSHLAILECKSGGYDWFLVTCVIAIVVNGE